jgi:hypothetical protein
MKVLVIDSPGYTVRSSIFQTTRYVAPIFDWQDFIIGAYFGESATHLSRLGIYLTSSNIRPRSSKHQGFRVADDTLENEACPILSNAWPNSMCTASRRQ